MDSNADLCMEEAKRREQIQRLRARFDEKFMAFALILFKCMLDNCNDEYDFMIFRAMFTEKANALFEEFAGVAEKKLDEEEEEARRQNS